MELLTEPCLLTQKNSPQIFLLHASFFFSSYPLQSELLESTFLVRIQLQTKVPLKRICNECIAKSKVKKTSAHVCVGTGFSNGLHFQTEAQLSHFHLEKMTCIVLKLHTLPSGNKILNFATFQASHILLQKQCKPPSGIL